jgi:hypothetical protein
MAQNPNGHDKMPLPYRKNTRGPIVPQAFLFSLLLASFAFTSCDHCETILPFSASHPRRPAQQPSPQRDSKRVIHEPGCVIVLAQIGVISPQ